MTWLFSLVRMLLGMKRLTTEWQVGDGREDGALAFVVAHAKPGDLDDAIRAIDDYAKHHMFLMNVGDEKGAILDAAVARVKPLLMLEVGAYVGYSALRIVRQLPKDGRLVSVEINAANASIARRIAEHAGVGDRVTFVNGSLDNADTMRALEEQHGFGAGKLDAVFLDHHKMFYLPDLERMLARGWLHTGSVVVADNIRIPGAPKYRAYMKAEEGKRWKSRTHKTHVEYVSFVPDIVLESTFLGPTTTTT